MSKNVAIKLESLEEGDDMTSICENNVEKITSLYTLGPFLAAQDNTKNTRYLSDVPDICQEKPCMLGVDEAGRGPVLGPMVYGIAYCPLERKKVLSDLGCADSKELSEDKREMIFNNITTKEYANTCLGWAVEIISPSVISTSMLSPIKCSLNEISMNAAADLIQTAINANVNISEIYVDTVGPPEKYQARLQKLFPFFKITVAKKADSTYPIVSAASICAKVTRDHSLKEWRFPEGLKMTSKDFGSGYPGDPVTKRFLKDNIDPVFGFPRLVRFSWSTAEKILSDNAYEMIFDTDDNEVSNISEVKLSKFFRNTTKDPQTKRKTCRLLRDCCLEYVTDF